MSLAVSNHLNNLLLLTLSIPKAILRGDSKSEAVIKDSIFTIKERHMQIKFYAIINT
jgi:hypothetical protein